MSGGVVEKVKSEVEKFLEDRTQYRGAVIIADGEYVAVGEATAEIGRSVLDTINFIDAVFRKLAAGPPRYFVAEGNDFGVSYGKFGFGKAVVLIYSGLPIGAAMYDIKSLCRRLSAFLP
ncbi:hypothetical protein [Infirmifilum sp. NZ]|uniref:hypothetical protein n=1 Tax=Infirmifilum sp. NZ TaxID=2926850 RepID=UPI0027A56214|nr:hypothetical protein [Infirmifilum sp. NZ]UNQ74018.1 hypothetical protein MOV14_03120 [Infirmifilum sp. NZ]